jgi:hypothetical protein
MEAHKSLGRSSSRVISAMMERMATNIPAAYRWISESRVVTPGTPEGRGLILTPTPANARPKIKTSADCATPQIKDPTYARSLSDQWRRKLLMTREARTSKRVTAVKKTH